MRYAEEIMENGTWVPGKWRPGVPARWAEKRQCPNCGETSYIKHWCDRSGNGEQAQCKKCHSMIAP